jgi:hypothetical protein
LVQAPRIGGASLTRGTVSLKVVANPALPGALYLIQRATTTGEFTTVFTGNLGSDGTAAQVLTGQTPGATYRYRAYVYGSDNSATIGAYSAPYTIPIM